MYIYCQLVFTVLNFLIKSDTVGHTWKLKSNFELQCPFVVQFIVLFAEHSEHKTIWDATFKIWTKYLVLYVFLKIIWYVILRGCVMSCLPHVCLALFVTVMHLPAHTLWTVQPLAISEILCNVRWTCLLWEWLCAVFVWGMGWFCRKQLKEVRCHLLPLNLANCHNFVTKFCRVIKLVLAASTDTVMCTEVRLVPDLRFSQR